ncbi:S8 family serine peptidase, partial [Geomonas terrae]|uniref:S8 family serine peptidase n=1 Tax=Geomonas terrae TaxID=2562681 RepID=UPI0018E07B1F
MRLSSGLSAEQESDVIVSNGGVRKAKLRKTPLQVVSLAPGETQRALDKYRKDPRVVSVEVNQVRKAAGVTNDPAYESQWALPKIGWDKVYGAITPAGTATVAILDSGVDATHPDLAGKVLPGTSILDGSDGLTDLNGHGTAMAGIIAAVADNGVGMAGVAPGGVRVMPVTVLDADGEGLDSDIIDGIRWAADNGATVILMPFSNPTFSQNLQDAIDYAWSKGCVLVAATGNEGSGSPTFPAGDRGVVGVSATDPSDALLSFSNYGSDVYVAAPGAQIYSTAPGGGYASMTGTSASAAIAAGIAAYVKAVSPALSNGVVVGRLGSGASAIGSPAQTGHGRVDLAGTLASKDVTYLQPAGVGGGTTPVQDPYLAAGTCDKLLFLTVPFIANALAVTEVIVEAHNGSANCTFPSPGTTLVNLSSDSAGGGFYSDPSGTNSITTVSLSNPSSNKAHQATFYYKDSYGGTTPIIRIYQTGAGALTDASQTETINKVSQSITFNKPADLAFTTGHPTVTATASSGLVPTFTSSTTGVCTVTSGGSLTLISTGNCAINADQAGDVSYSAAPTVAQTFAVTPLPQSITFTSTVPGNA